MAIVMMAIIFWIAILMVEIAVAPMLKQTIAQNVNALMKIIQPKKQQQLQHQQQQLPLVLVIVLLKHVDGLGMAIVMTVQIIWIAILMVEIAVAPMLTKTIVQHVNVLILMFLVKT